MIKKESTKLGYIADYKKDVDDIIDLLKTYPENAEMKKNFLSSVVEMVERTYDITIECEFQDIEGFECILPNKFKELSKKISQDLEKYFWGFLYSIYKNLGSENEAKSLILEYIDEQDSTLYLDCVYMCANDEFIPELMYALMTSIVDYIPEAVGDLKAAFESNVQ